MVALRRIGKYEIVGELGRGGMAVVHLARSDDGSQVALKELGGFHNGDDAAAQRFLREAVVGSSLNHPNIVKVIERLEHAGTPFIVMEWVDGGTLRPFVGELSVAQLGGALESLLSALDHAGRAGIVHRDLKPENVMLTHDGIVKVADFGIAKAKSVVEGMDGRLTRTGTAVGTPGYMAPEQAMGGEVSPATDIYATGCIAFEALTGRTPFAGQAPMVMLMSHANADVPDLRTIDPLIAAPIADWVAKATARDPDDRFSDGKEAWAALAPALEEAIGADWRSGATITPEVAEIAPPSSTPIGDGSGPATGAFRTFAAPIALHEQLAEELGERPVIGAPKSSGAATPAPENRTRSAVIRAIQTDTVTPPPSPVAPKAAPSSATEAPPRSNRRGLLIGLGVLVVVGGVGGAIAAGGGGSSGPALTGPAVTSAGVTVHVPKGWGTGTLPATAGIRVSQAAAPAGSSSGQGIGLLAAAPAPALLSSLDGALGGSVKAVSIGGGRAVSVTGGPGTRGAELIVAPVSSGQIATIVCRGSTALGECSNVAKTATGLASTPSSRDTETANSALALQGPLIASQSRALGSAHDGNEQAAAAGQIGRAYIAQQGALRAAPVSPGAHVALLLLAGPLGDLGSAWSNWASAVNSGRGTGSAAAAIRQARTELASVKAATAALGMSLSVNAGPLAPRAQALAKVPTVAPTSGSSGSSSGSGSGSSSSGSGSKSSGSGSSSSGSGSKSSGSSSSSSPPSSSGSSSSGSSPSSSSTPSTPKTSTPKTSSGSSGSSSHHHKSSGGGTITTSGTLGG